MKKILAVIFSLAILSGCTANEGTEVTESVSETAAAVSETLGTTAVTTETTAETTTTTAAVSESVSETTSATTTFVTEEKIPIDAEVGVNSDGTLNETFTARIEQIMEPHMQMAMGSVYPTLWDFDEDGVPEIILIFHSGSQENMPCKVYDPKTLEEIGEFEGFCRDGFTRFTNGYDVGTAIYSYYEHSNWRRMETVEFVHMELGKLVSDKKITRLWQTGEMYNPSMVVYSDNSEEANGIERDFLDWKFGTVCTSYKNFDIDYDERAAVAVESYNNYIKVYKITKEDYPVGSVLIGKKNEAAVYEVGGDGFFMDENGNITPLENKLPYINIYKLWNDIIVCQPLGNTQPCDVYIMTDGKPVLDEKLSGHGMNFDYSHLYNDGFELTESVYDASTGGSHTFKKYQLYRDESGFHEYGSIDVPLEEFNELYGKAAQKCIDELQTEEEISGMEIYEVMYRGDCCFILNCTSPIFCGEEDKTPCAYRFYNLTLKPTDDGFALVYWDRGVYKNALIPEIAVYPEKYYTEDGDGDEYIVW